MKHIISMDRELHKRRYNYDKDKIKCETCVRNHAAINDPSLKASVPNFATSEQICISSGAGQPNKNSTCLFQQL